MERLQRIMIGNGLLVVLVSMLSGYMLMFNLLGGFEVWPGKIIAIPSYGTSDGWVRAHTGGALNGVLVIIVGLAMPKLNLSAAMQNSLPGALSMSHGLSRFFIGSATLQVTAP